MFRVRYIVDELLGVDGRSLGFTGHSRGVYEAGDLVEETVYPEVLHDNATAALSLIMNSASDRVQRQLQLPFI